MREKWFTLIGVRHFQKIVRSYGHKFQKNHYFLQGNDMEALLELKERTEFNQNVHIVGLLVNLLIFFVAVEEGSILGFILNTLVFLLNLYLIFLQRYHLLRLHRILDKKEQKIEEKEREEE